MAHGGPSTDVKEPPELTLNCSSQLAVPLSVSTPDVTDMSPSFVDMQWPSRHHSGFSKPALPCYNIMTSTHRLITWRGMVSGPNGKRIAVTILFDTGSQADCISTTLANRLGYTEQSLDAHARTASGEHLRAPMLTSPVTLRIGQHYRADIPMRSVALSSFDVILGMPWCKRHGITFDATSGVVSFSHRNRTIILEPLADPPSSSPDAIHHQSAF